MHGQVKQTQRSVQSLAQQILDAENRLAELRESQDALARQVDMQTVLASESERRLLELKKIRSSLHNSQVDTSEELPQVFCRRIACTAIAMTGKNRLAICDWTGRTMATHLRHGYPRSV